MAQIIQLGQPPIDVTVRHSARARRISLRISGLDGKVSLTVPGAGSMRQAQRFLQEREDWIRQNLEAQPKVLTPNVGSTIPISGKLYNIQQGHGRRVLISDDAILIPGPPHLLVSKLKAFLRELARDHLVEASQRHAIALGRPFGKITLRDTRSRWGSCSSEGNLMYSWRLILAPNDVLDYVAAHEVAHLAEMNHSAKFWSTVSMLMPEYEAPRRWLRKNGAELHKYQF